MTKRKAESLVDRAIEALAEEGRPVSVGEVARLAGVTRQAAYNHVRRMLEEGRLRRQGAGRGTRYVGTWDFRRAYPIAGLEESAIWEEIRDEVPAIRDSSSNVRNLLNYAFTEMLNNAIDHSDGNLAQVAASDRGHTIEVEILDDGVGAFRRVRERWNLPDDLAAVGELAKGKRTTLPQRHSGEGIFFTSKAVDHFVLESGEYRWRVDNVRDDMSVGKRAQSIRGTRVGFDLDLTTTRTLSDVFQKFSTEGSQKFDRSAFIVRLFEAGSAFLSRSEAKRLAAGLDEFDEVILDFAGVEEVGQGFVDELFRVWNIEHPGTRLRSVNMNDAVEFMVARGLPPAEARR
jgi:DNA-binding Lrp family transcriptional regulator